MSSSILRSRSSTHRHRHGDDHHSLAAHHDPAWRWSSHRGRSPLTSPRSEPRTRAATIFESFTAPLDEAAAGESAATPRRRSSVGAGYTTPTSSLLVSPKSLSPPLLSGQGRSPSRDADEGDGSFSARRSSAGYASPAQAWGGRGLPAAAGESSAGAGYPRATAPTLLPSRISSAAGAGAPVRLHAPGQSMGSPPLPATPPPSSYLIPPPQPQDVGKLVVVLDLDETLVYSRDITLYERPGVLQLLKALKGRCELIVWTAGTRDYALDVIRVIDTVCAVQHCIYRHPMWWTSDVGCMKDLRMLGRPMDRVILVDNTPSVFRANPRNSLLVSDFLVPSPRLYNAHEKVLSTLADIFDHVFRRCAQPSLADVLASRRIVRQLVHLDSGEALELNVLRLRSSVDAGWSTSSRLSRTRYGA